MGSDDLKFGDLIKKYLGFFILAVAVIIVYKTFDNLGRIFDFLKTFCHLLTPFFIGFAIAFVLYLPCKKVENLFRKVKIKPIQKFRRGFSILTVYMGVIALIILIMVAIIPQLIESITRFIDQLPNIERAFDSWISGLGILPDGISGIGDFIEKNVLTFNNVLKAFEGDNINKYAKGVMDIGSSVLNIFIGLIVSIYMLLERINIKKTMRSLSNICFPKKFRRNLRYYGRMIVDFIHKYIGCQLVDAVIVFVLCLIVLSIMRNEYAAVIALMVGSFNLIPYFGAIIAVFIAAVLTLFTKGFVSAIVLVVVLIVLQQLDANVIQPRLISNSLSIEPLLVIFGVIVGGGLFGIIGMFIGVPIVALIKNVIVGAIDKRNHTKSEDADLNV